MLTGLNHITLAVNDLEQSLAFYVDVLGMSSVVKWNKGAYLSLGELWFCLSCDEVKPSDDYSHIAFSIDKDRFDEFQSLLTRHEVARWKQNSSEGLSSYILDPDGHKLEVHCGDLHSRLDALKTAPYEGLEWC